MTVEQILALLILSHLQERPCGVNGIFPGIYEDHDLMSTLQHAFEFLESGLVNIVTRCFGPRFSFYADEMLLKRHWPERGIKVEQPCHAIHLEEVGHINIVWQSCRKANDPNEGLSAFDLPFRSSNKRFNYSATFVMEHVNFINDEKFHLLYKLGITRTLAGDNIPFLRCCHNNLGLDDVFLCQVHISSILTNLDAEPRKTPPKLLGNLGRQCFHWGHVDDLEFFGID